MLRQDSSSINSDHGLNPSGLSPSGTTERDLARSGGVDIQRELNRLEEIILDSPRIPLSRRTLIDEEQLLEQLDLIRLSLPEAFHEADNIVRHKEETLLEADQIAQEILDAAQRRAEQIMNEMGILRQAEIEAQQLRQRVQQECELAKEQTINEIDRLRRQARQELDEMQRLAVEECEEIQAGADEYADRVLREMEMQLGEMMRVVRNGRQQLQPLPPESVARSSPASRSLNPKGDRGKN